MVKDVVGQFLKSSESDFFCHICNIEKITYENNFSLDCFPYDYIKSQFQNICYNFSFILCYTYNSFNYIKKKKKQQATIYKGNMVKKINSRV